MKTIPLVVVALVAVLMSCENPVRMKTKVHDDGSLDKTIVLEKTDSSHMYQNPFGISEATGWKMTSEKVSTGDDKSEFKIQFEKRFPSAEAMNADLDKPVDTLFQIQSKFEKNFRWFYTYIRYSETFRPIDRLKMIKATDYFTEEDRAFFNRLPGEGTPISKADSLYLQLLNEKIFDHYGRWGLFEEEFNIISEIVKRNLPDKKWLDTLNKNKEFIYDKLEEMEDDPFFAAKMADSLGIPLPKEKAKQDFIDLSKPLNSRITFMSFARDGKYLNIFEMPWTIVNYNADSVAGNQLYWKPLATKFAIQEYEMFAEARKLNLWAVAVSIGIVGLTLFMFFSRKTN